jgi:hypothetical protein
MERKPLIPRWLTAVAAAAALALAAPSAAVAAEVEPTALSTAAVTAPTEAATSAARASTPWEPLNVYSSADGSTRSTTLYWEAPDYDGGSAITGYRVSRNGTDASGAGPWSTIVSASARSQKFTNLEAGSEYYLTVSAINAYGTGYASASWSYIPYVSAPETPRNVTATKNDGARTATLTWDAPWDDGGGAITGYEVSRNGVDASGNGPWSIIVSASTRSRTFSNLALGSTYTLSVRAINSAGSSIASSSSVRMGSAALTAATPTITGTAKVGATLTANPGAWGPAPVAYAYQWKADGTALSGATASTYKPTSATLGKRITVTVTGSKTGYTAASRTSAATAAVANGTLTAVKPTISGTVKVGSTLTANPGAWGPAPVSLVYQWMSNGTAISGATGSTYKPTSAVLGRTITVTVTGSKTGYTRVTRTSDATAAVVAGTLVAPTPTVSGTAKVGFTLTANPGAWGPAPVTLTYQWKANGVAISGATSSTFKPTSSTVGKKVTVTVTGKKTAYTTVSRTSAATATVVK